MPNEATGGYRHLDSGGLIERAESLKVAKTLRLRFVIKEVDVFCFEWQRQISTRRGVTSQSIELRIVEPQAILVGAPDVYVGVGSPFTITCAITNVSGHSFYKLFQTL